MKLKASKNQYNICTYAIYMLFAVWIIIELFPLQDINLIWYHFLSPSALCSLKINMTIKKEITKIANRKTIKH